MSRLSAMFREPARREALAFGTAMLGAVIIAPSIAAGVITGPILKLDIAQVFVWTMGVGFLLLLGSSVVSVGWMAVASLRKAFAQDPTNG